MSFRVRSGAAEMHSAELASLKQSSSAPTQRRSASVRTFRSLVWEYWKENGRHDLTWRKTSDPYRILISEVMLQQTQVDRVISKYKEFLKTFPNVRALAKASLADVLKVWNGLGYNRRAKYLRDAAIEIVEKHGAKVPREYESLRNLSGVGDYTARAIRVFAFNEPDVLIETNIRTALIHHFFDIPYVSDRAIKEYAERTAKGQDPREWYLALMDYGAYLKRSGLRNNHRSVHYAKQSKFEGSLRQLRGALLRALAQHGHIRESNYVLIRANKNVVAKALNGLARDGLVVSRNGKWRIA